MRERSPVSFSPGFFLCQIGILTPQYPRPPSIHPRSILVPPSHPSTPIPSCTHVPFTHPRLVHAPHPLTCILSPASHHRRVPSTHLHPIYLPCPIIHTYIPFTQGVSHCTHPVPSTHPRAILTPRPILEPPSRPRIPIPSSHPCPVHAPPSHLHTPVQSTHPIHSPASPHPHVSSTHQRPIYLPSSHHTHPHPVYTRVSPRTHCVPSTHPHHICVPASHCTHPRPPPCTQAQLLLVLSGTRCFSLLIQPPSH